MSILQQLESFDPIATEDTLPARFERMAAAHGAQLAVCSETWQATYRELNDTANRLAHALIARGGAVGERVAVLMQHDTPQIAVMLAIAKAGRIAVALNPRDPAARHAMLLADSGARLLIADQANGDAAVGQNCAVILFDHLAAGGPSHDPGIRPAPDDIAMLVYTSGSTGSPKGVVQTHRQSLQGILTLAPIMGVMPGDRLVLLGALTGRQGIGMMWLALVHGVTVYPFPAMERGVTGLADLMTENAITVYISSASLFRHFVRTLDEHTRFPRMRAVRLASESATSDDFKAFRRHFPRGCALVHALSCSEAGNIAQIRLTHDDIVADGHLPVGKPPSGIEIKIVGENGERARDGESGEIVVRSRHISDYWPPAPSHDRLSSIGPPVREFHTGDLGRINAQGQLEYLGRKDDRVKIRGYRINPVEIEAAILRIAGVRETFVGAHGEPGQAPHLVAYVVVAPPGPASGRALRRALSASLPSYMLPTSFVLLDELPRTANGKIDRLQLSKVRPPDGKSETYEPPETETQWLLAAAWEDALDQIGIGRRDDFFDLGGDSLSAAVVAVSVHERLGVQINLDLFADYPALADLAAAIDKLRQASPDNAGPPESLIEPLSSDSPIPLSIEQTPMWHESRPPENSIRHTWVRSWRLVGPLDAELFRDCLAAAALRHEILRTSFALVNGKPAQIVHPPDAAVLPIANYDFTDDADAELSAWRVMQDMAATVFDLEKLPLLRSALIRLRADEHRLVHVAHHIIFDGTSWTILHRDVARLYRARLRGQSVAYNDAPILQYAEYAVRQSQALQPGGKQFSDSLAWWTKNVLMASAGHPLVKRLVIWCVKNLYARRQSLKGRLGSRFNKLVRLPRALDLPFKRGSEVQSADPAEAVIHWTVKPDTVPHMKALASQEDAADSDIILAAYVALLAAETGNPDVVLGTYVSNRERTKAWRSFGYFANLAMLIYRCDENRTFRQFLSSVCLNTRKTREHGEFCHDTLRRELGVWRLRLPEIRGLVGVASPHHAIRFAGIELIFVDERPIGAMPTDFDMKIDRAVNAQGGILAFDAKLYDPGAVRAFIARLVALLDIVSRNPDLAIGEAVALASGRDA